MEKFLSEIYLSIYFPRFETIQRIHLYTYTIGEHNDEKYLKKKIS